MSITTCFIVVVYLSVYVPSVFKAKRVVQSDCSKCQSSPGRKLAVPWKTSEENYFSAYDAIPISEPNNWVLRHLLYSFFEELNGRA